MNDSVVRRLYDQGAVIQGVETLVIYLIACVSSKA